MNITFNGIWRMDWGFGNPNLTAALLISLLCLVWLPAYFFRRGYWFSLLAATVIGVCLIHTMSRGGILGGVVAMTALIGFVPRPWPIKRVLGAGCAIWVVILATFFLNIHQRLGQGITSEDKSITHRLEIWKAAPQMLAVQPFGWGWNGAGRAYAEWFQPAGRNELYGSLVNTHLTKVVELGVIGGAVYLFVWLLSLFLSWPSPRSRWRAVFFALLLGFGIAATFTNMARHWQLWVIPALAIAAVIVNRLRFRDALPVGMVALAIILSILTPFTIYLAGRNHISLQIRKENQVVILGNGNPSFWILADDKLLGENYRRKLREYIAERPDFSVCLVDRVEHLPPTLNTPLLVASSVDAVQARDLASRGSYTLFLNPGFSPSDIAEYKSVAAIFGELSKSRHLTEWQGSSNTIKLPGIGDFIPNWPQTLLELPKG